MSSPWRYGEGPWLDAWQENAALAMNCTEPMTRGGGAEVIFVGALSVGMDDYHSGAYLQADIDGSTQGAALEGAPWRADLLPILDAPYENKVWGETYESGFQGAERYVWHRASAVSHKTLMEYDPDTLSMDYDEPFSRGEAIVSALRCYESWVDRDYVSTDDPRATAFDTGIITADLLEKESSLPEVSHDTLPAQWRGLSIYSKGQLRPCPPGLLSAAGSQFFVGERHELRPGAAELHHSALPRLPGGRQPGQCGGAAGSGPNGGLGHGV